MNTANRPPRNPWRSGARILDAAEGVLLALRGCSINQAFDEIVQTANRYNVNALSLAEALVAIAEVPYRYHVDERAVIAARTTWGDLLDRFRPDGAGRPSRTQPAEQPDPSGDELVSGA